MKRQSTLDVGWPRAHGWAQDVSAYNDAAKEYRRTLKLPILTPQDETQRQRWTDILAFYGLSEAMSEPVATSGPAPSFSGRIFVIGEDWAAPARFYADCTGRPATRFDDLEACLKSSPPELEPVMFFGPPDIFSLHNCDRIEAWAKQGWGFLTASDLAGLSFMVAKLLAPPVQACWGSLIVDILGRRLWVGEQNEALTAERLATEIVSPASKLVIRAHGEGGHVNLESIVLCGLAGSEEWGPNGPLQGGCRFGSDKRRCKRAPDPNTQILTFAELPSPEIHLLTCASSLMTGELYPSNVSATLSLADGYAREALLNNRIVDVHSGMADWLLSQRENNTDAVTICATLNDIQSKTIGCRPYIWFGDPGTRCNVAKSDVSASVIGLDVASNPDQILEVKNVSPDAYVEAGETCLIGWQDHPGSEPPAILDATQRLEDVQSWLPVLAARRAGGADLEFGIERLYSQRLEKNEDMREALSLLRDIRQMIDHSAYQINHLCNTSTATGILEPGLASEIGNAMQLIALWDRHFAILMANHLFGGPCYKLPGEGLVAVSRPGEPCDYCGLATRHFDMSPREGVRLVCTLCGGKAAWHAPGPRLAVNHAPHLRRGEPTEVTLEFTEQDSTGLDRLHQGIAVVHAQDKALRVFHRSLVVVSEPNLTVEVVPPPEIAPELHTLHIALVRGMRFEVIRRRWPVLDQ